MEVKVCSFVFLCKETGKTVNWLNLCVSYSKDFFFGLLFKKRPEQKQWINNIHWQQKNTCKNGH